jgi:hypothetical protein
VDRRGALLASLFFSRAAVFDAADGADVRLCPILTGLGREDCSFPDGVYAVTITAWVLYGSMFVVQLGVHTAAEYRLYSAQALEAHLLRNSADSRKVLFVGGSNV